MTNPSVASPVEGGADSDKSHRNDDASDATPSVKRQIQPKDPPLIEKTIKFRFSCNDQRDSISPETLHLHWIQIVQETYGKMLHIYSNKGTIMPKVDTMRWNAMQHSQHFNVHRQIQTTRQHKHDIVGDRNSTVFIIHRIRTGVSITEIRNNPKIRAMMLDNGVSMSEHRWPEDVWNTTQMGFMLGIDPQFYTDAQAHERITQALVRKLSPNIKVPKFKMAFCTPQTEYNGIRIRTKAFAVETEKHTSVE
jgi:hypothetical protein